MCRSIIDKFSALRLREVLDQLGEIELARYFGIFDASHVINPRIARAQLIGSITYEIGMALTEQTQWIRTPAGTSMRTLLNTWCRSAPMGQSRTCLSPRTSIWIEDVLCADRNIVTLARRAGGLAKRFDQD
jgi:hypothetical protein